MTARITCLASWKTTESSGICGERVTWQAVYGTRLEDAIATACERTRAAIIATVPYISENYPLRVEAEKAEAVR